MDKTLVILAAGMGSRFGGLKQIEPVGPSGEVIADYSVYDALVTGFTKVVFVIKKENLAYFQEHITKKYESKIKVEFAFQSLDEYQDFIPEGRIKMLGTAHALYCAKDKVNEPFVMINADDFYGRDAYFKASEFLENSTDAYEYLSVNFPYINSTSKNGKVNRGVVKVQNDEIIDIEECSIEEVNKEILATSKKTGEVMKIAPTAPVSMNFLVFKPTIFSLLEKDLTKFIQNDINETNELILTDVIKHCLKNNQIKFKATLTSGKWLGMTYRDDLIDIKKTLQELIEAGIYPVRLWEE